MRIFNCKNKKWGKKSEKLNDRFWNWKFECDGRSRYQFLLFFTPISHGEQKIRSLMHLLLLAKYCDGIIDNVQHCKDEFMMAQLGSIEGKKEKPACINLSLLAPPFYTWSRFQKTRLKLSSQRIPRAKRAKVHLTFTYQQTAENRKQLKNVNKQLKT